MSCKPKLSFLENPHLQNGHKYLFGTFLFLLILVSCSDNAEENPSPNAEGEKINIFFVNDMHGQLENFAKIKHIVDQAKAETPSILVSAGDLFSGSPYVDQYAEPGFPMIDIMNKTGFDVSVLGNHEFDYGLEELQERIDESQFGWVCANVDASGTALNQPDAYTTVEVGGIRVTFLGLVETYGREGVVAPAAHPWRMRGLTFQDHKDVVDQYANLKADENADAFIALTHLGTIRDIILANSNSFLDGIIGGHSNDINVNYFNDIPVVMAGANLAYLGKLELTVNNKEVVASNVSMISLSAYQEKDEVLEEAISAYLDNPAFDTVVGVSETEMDELGEVGCFFTTALKERLDVDMAIQNLGGLRNPIDQGEITALEIYQLDPFNNQSVIYELTVSEFKRFLVENNGEMAFSGIDLSFTGANYEFRDETGTLLDDSATIRLGMNDFIPALYDNFFSYEATDIKDVTTAETLIEYLDIIQNTVNFEGCERQITF